ncbi:MAG: ribbon-helix-helix domain-containing protein [Thermodesulfobacteriota bacterium]
MEREKISVFLDKTQIENLKALSGFTRVKMADYIREGIDIVLDKYQKELKKAQKEGR